MQRLESERTYSWLLSASLFSLILATTALLPAGARADDWPQWLGPQRDGVWRETGIVKTLPTKDKLKVRWRVKIGGGYAGPAVADGRVFVMDRLLPAGVKGPASGFTKARVPGKERVLCLDEKTGNILWQRQYDCPYTIQYPAGPRCTPVVSADKVWTLGAMGDLYCLNVKDGEVLWSHNFVKDYQADPQVWGFAGHPLLDGDRLICLVGGEGGLAMAFDKDTGKVLWKSINANGAGYAPPMICEVGGKRELIFWHASGVHALNPKTGAVYWSHRWPKSGSIKVNLAVSMPRYDPEHRCLFVTAFYEGSLMLQLNKDGSGVKELWKSKVISEQPDRTEHLHSIIPTPFIQHGYIFGICSYGELRCLNEETGERLWFTRKATTANDQPVRWGNAFLVAHGDKFFLFNEFGDLILADVTPKGYEEHSRVNLLPPTNSMAGFGGQRRLVLWSHPAFANRCVYVRNDNEIICVSLAAADYR